MRAGSRVLLSWVSVPRSGFCGQDAAGVDGLDFMVCGQNVGGCGLDFMVCGLVFTACGQNGVCCLDFTVCDLDIGVFILNVRVLMSML